MYNIRNIFPNKLTLHSLPFISKVTVFTISTRSYNLYLFNQKLQSLPFPPEVSLYLFNQNYSLYLFNQMLQSLLFRSEITFIDSAKSYSGETQNKNNIIKKKSFMCRCVNNLYIYIYPCMQQEQGELPCVKSCKNVAGFTCVGRIRENYAKQTCYKKFGVNKKENLRRETNTRFYIFMLISIFQY